MAGNSWQQPVAGEPSAGTWHDIAAPSDAIIYTGVLAAWTSITFVIGTGAGTCPTGTKKIKCSIKVYGGASNCTVYYRPYGSGEGNKPARVIAYHYAAGNAGNAHQIDLPIDSSGRVDINADSGVNVIISSPFSYSI